MGVELFHTISIMMVLQHIGIMAPGSIMVTGVVKFSIRVIIMVVGEDTTMEEVTEDNSKDCLHIIRKSTPLYYS